MHNACLDEYFPSTLAEDTAPNNQIQVEKLSLILCQEKKDSFVVKICLQPTKDSSLVDEMSPAKLNFEDTFLNVDYVTPKTRCSGLIVDNFEPENKKIQQSK